MELNAKTYFYLESENEIKLSAGEVRLTSEATVKFPPKIEKVISPELNRLPDTAKCYTIFVPEQVKLHYINSRICLSTLCNNHFEFLIRRLNVYFRFGKHSFGGKS